MSVSGPVPAGMVRWHCKKCKRDLLDTLPFVAAVECRKGHKATKKGEI